MARNFICPTTESPCDRSDCTRRACTLATELEARAKEARWNYLRDHPEKVTLADLFDDD